MLRKGFTLIELLIVVTIIAILAGAAIPYVADYIEQSKISRCKVDLVRIRNALTRWELDRKEWEVTESSAAKLVGPYLQKAAVDPFGQPYIINSYMSLVYSAGPDLTDNAGAGDDIGINFRPRMAATKVRWLDTTGDGTIDIGDSIIVSCTRPVVTPSMVPGGGTSIDINGDTLATLCTNAATASGRKAVYVVQVAPTVARPGCSVVVSAAADIDDSPADQTSDAVNVANLAALVPPVAIVWAANQSLKADADLILQSE